MSAAATMLVTVRLFAALRERAGTAELAVELPEGACVADALAALRARSELSELMDRMPVVLAVNRDYAPEDRRLAAGDELALIPPVSGGAAHDVHARVTDEPLDLAALAARVGRPGAGATVTFSGTTRDVDALEYEAYVEMATERMAAILDRCARAHDLQAAAAEHRVGTVVRGEPSVIVAASAAHRAEAFAGAREAIDAIKSEAPIWKREVEGARRSWVQGSAPTAGAPGGNA